MGREEGAMKSMEEWQIINFVCHTKGSFVLSATEGGTINFVSES